jgi:hypothetical protein
MISRNPPQKSNRSDSNVPDDLEPGSPPAEHEQGMVPTSIPDDPERDRVVSPNSNQAIQDQFTGHQAEVSKSP